MAAEFIRVWLTFSLMIIGAAVFAAVWAARAGHFRDQDRARKLALWAHAEEDSEPEGDLTRRRNDARHKPDPV